MLQRKFNLVTYMKITNATISYISGTSSCIRDAILSIPSANSIGDGVIVDKVDLEVNIEQLDGEAKAWVQQAATEAPGEVLEFYF